ncbi:hypothetical protein RHGRI_001864 [Rhododendron griersonianum]|uniref:Uncharacterized protein n=1 Tax=Rhododendron griersonianum TaxID=479676 RepID=A0AAV6LQN9_9ERIC|nr:hypothetical protein RHGRI_001864 [Rhododendron griersonianum]
MHEQRVIQVHHRHHKSLLFFSHMARLYRDKPFRCLPSSSLIMVMVSPMHQIKTQQTLLSATHIFKKKKKNQQRKRSLILFFLPYFFSIKFCRKKRVERVSRDALLQEGEERDPITEASFDYSWFDT